MGNLKIERGMGRMKIKQSIVPQNPMAHVVRVGVARKGAEEFRSTSQHGAKEQNLQLEAQLSRY